MNCRVPGTSCHKTDLHQNSHTVESVNRMQFHKRKVVYYYYNKCNCTCSKEMTFQVLLSSVHQQSSQPSSLTLRKSSLAPHRF